MWGGLRLGFRTDVSCRIEVSRKEAKTQRRQRTGSSCVVAGSLLAGLFFWIYSLRLGVLSDSYGAWKPARTAGRETHTTLGPTPRRAASGGRKWEVDVVLLFSGLASIDGSESVSNSFANGRR